MKDIFGKVTLEAEVKSIDLPHLIEVGSEVTSDDWPGVPFRTDTYRMQDAVIHHTRECPYEVTFNDVSAVTKIDPHGTTWCPEYQVRWLCTLGLEEDHYGIDYLISEVIGLSYGLWNVRGWFERDRWGEGDVEFEIHRLEGPVDERHFEGELVWKS